MLATLLALVIHQVREELRKLDAAGTSTGDVPAADPASTTAADTERAPAWDHDTRAPAARLGFSPGHRP